MSDAQPTDIWSVLQRLLHPATAGLGAGAIAGLLVGIAGLLVGGATTLLALLLVGPIVGLAHAALEPWLRRVPSAKGLAFGAYIFLAAGSPVIDADDVVVDGPTLDVVLVAILALLLGTTVTGLYTRISSRLPSLPPSRPVSFGDGIAYLVMAAVLLGSISISVGTFGLGLLTISMLVMCHELGRNVDEARRSGVRSRSITIAYLVPLLPLAIGGYYTIGSVAEAL